MKIVCDCLNLKIEVNGFHTLEVINIDLSSEEKCHPYFIKDVYKMPGVSGISEVHSQLMKSEIIGSWNICQCLICKVFTHGTNYVTGLITCSSFLKEEPVDLKAFGQLKNMSYSQVFHICFPSRLDIPEDYLSNLTNCDLVASEYIENISKQANSFLEMAETKMRNSNASLEKQQQAMEALNRRVKCEERYLHMLVLRSKNKNDLTPENVLKSSPYQCEEVRGGGVAAVSPTHYSEPVTTSESLSGNNNVQQRTSDLQRGRLNISRNSDDLQRELKNLQLNSSVERKHVQESRSAFSEGIFEMDDFASDLMAAAYIPEHDETESDDEVFPEFSSEELDTDRHISARDFARSVPLDVPAWPCAIDRHERAVDTKRPKDPQEIAASMRELARSVRTSSVDVFGELPRPKFLP